MLYASNLGSLLQISLLLFCEKKMARFEVEEGSAAGRGTEGLRYRTGGQGWDCRAGR